MTAPVAVIQADREFAANILSECLRPAGANAVRDGKCDTHPLVISVARHRLASSAPEVAIAGEALRAQEAVSNLISLCRLKYGNSDPSASVAMEEGAWLLAVLAQGGGA